MTPEEAVKEYQCPGCVGGPFETCYIKRSGLDVGCSSHVPGTMSPGIGKFFLGLPRGFCRVGPCDGMTVNIFNSIENGWGFNMFNVPVWKRLDSHGNTLVRGLSPRINSPFIHIYMGNHVAEIDCLEISDDDTNNMD